MTSFPRSRAMVCSLQPPEGSGSLSLSLEGESRLLYSLCTAKTIIRSPSPLPSSVPIPLDHPSTSFKPTSVLHSVPVSLPTASHISHQLSPLWRKVVFDGSLREGISPATTLPACRPMTSEPGRGRSRAMSRRARARCSFREKRWKKEAAWMMSSFPRSGAKPFSVFPSSSGSASVPSWSAKMFALKNVAWRRSRSLKRS